MSERGYGYRDDHWEGEVAARSQLERVFGEAVQVKVPPSLVAHYVELRDESNRLDDYTEQPGEWGDVNDVGELLDAAARDLADEVARWFA